MRTPFVALLLVGLAACSSGGAGAVDAGAPDGSTDADGTAPDGAADADAMAPDGDADADAAATDSLCCTSALCAAVGQACNPETCRCEAVPCSVEGEACHPDRLPGVDGELVCYRDPGGLFCHPVVASPEQCPPGLQGCGEGDAGCVCGAGACRVLMHDCPPGQRCMAGGYDPEPFGICTTAPGRGAGSLCYGSYDCNDGLLCMIDAASVPSTCEPIECGLAQGAGDCSPGKVCWTEDEQGQVGRCASGCKPYDLHGPCTSTSRCTRVSYGNLYACAPMDWQLAGPGQRCTVYSSDRGCLSGLGCLGDECVRACDPLARSGPGACPAGQDCLPSDQLGTCATPCDPFDKTACGSWGICVAMTRAGGSIGGHCYPTLDSPANLDEPCWSLCDSSLVCSGGFSPRCRPLCSIDPKAGHACPAGQHCFALPPNAYAYAPSPAFGFCNKPCTPGVSDCGKGSWCEPRELDPETGLWIGTCL